MPGCAVATCLMYSRISKGTGIIYHCFPKDAKVRKLWVRKCRRKDKFNVNASRVCSKHFTEQDYVRDLRAELLNIPRKKVLKPTAVPSQNLNVNSTSHFVSQFKRPVKPRSAAQQLNVLSDVETTPKQHRKHITPQKCAMPNSGSSNDVPAAGKTRKRPKKQLVPKKRVKREITTKMTMEPLLLYEDDLDSTSIPELSNGEGNKTKLPIQHLLPAEYEITTAETCSDISAGSVTVQAAIPPKNRSNCNAKPTSGICNTTIGTSLEPSTPLQTNVEQSGIVPHVSNAAPHSVLVTLPAEKHPKPAEMSGELRSISATTLQPILPAPKLCNPATAVAGSFPGVFAAAKPVVNLVFLVPKQPLKPTSKISGNIPVACNTPPQPLSPRTNFVRTGASASCTLPEVCRIVAQPALSPQKCLLPKLTGKQLDGFPIAGSKTTQPTLPTKNHVKGTNAFQDVSRVCSKTSQKIDALPRICSTRTEIGLPQIIETAKPAPEMRCDTLTLSDDEHRQDNASSLSREARYKKRDARKRVLNSLKTISLSQMKKHDETKNQVTIDVATETEEGTFCTKIETMKLAAVTARMASELRWRRSQVVKLKERVTLLSRKLSAVRKLFNEKQVTTKTKVRMEITRILGRVFTESQIKCLLKNQPSARWRKEDISKAIALRDISPKCYEYLRKKVGIPLPGKTTLRRYISKSSDFTYIE